MCIYSYTHIHTYISPRTDVQALNEREESDAGIDPRGALSNAPHHLNPSWDLQAEQVRVSTHQHKDAHGHDRTKDQRDTAQLSGCRGQRR